MESDATPKIMAPKMVSMWRDYVIPEKRWGRIRPFLYHFFDVYRREEKRIIDIAAGMGVEYYEMLHDGFDISANEVQDELRECGERYRRDMGFRTAYYPYRYSWLKLDESGETGKFYGLFALGNSLRMMSSSNVQQETLAKFGDMLRSGGTVMVDERNYGVIKNNAEKINELGNDRNSSRLFKDVHDLIHGAENPMYHGSNIGSIPYRVDSDNRVSFLFYDNREDIYTLRQAENHRIQDWVFLHDARMETMLEHAGFVDIQKYADYCLDKRLEQDMEEAAMHVFVAKKP